MTLGRMPWLNMNALTPSSKSLLYRMLFDVSTARAATVLHRLRADSRLGFDRAKQLWHTACAPGKMSYRMARQAE